MLLCAAACYSGLQCVYIHVNTVSTNRYCDELQRARVCCSVLQCAAVCCSVLQCVAVCCGVLQVGCNVYTFMSVSHANRGNAAFMNNYCGELQCVAVCCSVVQGAAMWCSAL